jgi:hypothetical protein
MRTSTGLIVVAVGAILAFAVQSSPSWFSFQITGWVIMLTGVAGMVLSRQHYGWRRWLEAIRRPRATVVKPDSGPRALGAGEVLHQPPDPGTPLPEVRPSVAGTTAEQIIPGMAQPAEGGPRSSTMNEREADGR